MRDAVTDTSKRGSIGIRLDKNLKQLEFADSIGLSQSGYSTLMGRDGTSQRLKTLALAIEAVYGFRHEWILHWRRT